MKKNLPQAIFFVVFNVDLARRRFSLGKAGGIHCSKKGKRWQLNTSQR
jgi:hypothetical protein